MSKTNSQSGNAIMMILIAAGLLGALSMVIAQGNRGSTEGLSDDRQKLAATEIIDYAETVAKAVTQLRLRGTAIESIRFATPDLPTVDYGTFGDSPRHEIFNPRGGGVVYIAPPEITLVDTDAQYHFLNRNEVEKIGTTCSDDRCVDVLMVLEDIKESTCKTINDLVGVDNPSGNPPTESDIQESGYYKGTFNFSRTIGDDDSALSGQSEGCFLETADTEYVYYKVLLAR